MYNYSIIKHFFLILLITGILTIGIFLPYIPGDYDYFATGISSIFQFAVFTSLLLIPVGLVWYIFNLTKQTVVLKHNKVFGRISLVVAIIVVLAAALGAFVSHNRFSAIIILLSGAFIVLAFRNKLKVTLQKNNVGLLSYYFIIIPLAVFLIRMTFLEKAKNDSTAFIIKQSGSLIKDIEEYKSSHGYYPVSLQSTIEDYKPSISGIDRFHYELNGNAYNLYFEQFSHIPGTQEIVMYNKLGEHEMTVHNQDLLRVHPANIFRGYHKVSKLTYPDWKVFYFD